MAVRLAILSAAHVHAPSYAACSKALPDAELTAVWDSDAARGERFAQNYETRFVANLNEALENCDAVVIASENVRHAELTEAAARAGKHVLCEKPLAVNAEQGEIMLRATREAGVTLMTAFPCPFSPAFRTARARVQNGDLGDLLAVCTTNRGSCPFGWFVEPEHSGGGAMIDHTVHVADLLRRVLGASPESVYAVTGHNMYGQAWDDTAMLALRYPKGVLATLDSSWSRPGSYKTWGDVTMGFVGSKGTLEIDLFAQSVEVYRDGAKTHTLAGYGSNLDLLMVGEFVAAIQEGRPPEVTGEDGWEAAKVALAGYASVDRREPVAP